MYERDEPISVLPEHLARATRGSRPDDEGSAPEEEFPHFEEPPPPVTSCVRRKDKYYNGCRKPCIIVFTRFAGLRSGTPHWFAPQVAISIPCPTRISGDGMKGLFAEQTVRTLQSDRRARTKKSNGACRADSHLTATFLRPKNRQRLICGARRCSGRSRIRNSRRICPCSRITVSPPSTKITLSNPACKEGAPEIETFQGGCQHYKRNCALKAECCGRFYTCRFCHDEASDHGDMDRFAAKEVSCMKCGTEQPVSNKCVNGECGIVFAHYFCAVCKFFDDSKKNVFHCEKCGICRAGKSEDSFHCDKCNSCVKRKYQATHKCHEDALRGNCPCCLEHLHSSVRPVLFMKCGHAMHSDCFDCYTRTKYTCPLCFKSLCDMSRYFKEVDKLLKLQTWKSESGDKDVEVKCNDCGGASRTRYHPWNLYKCGAGDGCESYNTIVKSVCDSHSHTNDI
jgi:hypothetical protein